MPRLAWNASKRRVPRNASRRTRSVQRSPITESVRAIVQSSLPTSLQRTRPYSSKMELDASGGDRASPGVRFGRLAARAREEAVELRERVLGEAELECAEARVELRQGARPDDGRRDGRVVQHPCQRHLGGRVAQLATERLVGRHPVTVALEQALLPLARAPALGRLLQGAAQEPSRERAVRNEPEAVRAAGRDDLELDRARHQAVDALLRHQTQEVARRRRGARLRDLPAGEVAAPDVEHLPLLDEHLHRLPQLVPRRVPVDVVHLVEVDVVGAQAAQAALARLADVRGGEAPVVRTRAHPPVDLRREDDPLAPAATLREPAADDLLGDALARAPAVHVGRVEEDDPELERAVHDCEAVALAGEWAEVHGAEAEPADPEPALAETDVVHAGVSTTPRGVSEHGPRHRPRSRSTCAARRGARSSANSRCASRSSRWRTASSPVNSASRARVAWRNGAYARASVMVTSAAASRSIASTSAAPWAPSSARSTRAQATRARMA